MTGSLRNSGTDPREKKSLLQESSEDVEEEYRGTNYVMKGAIKREKRKIKEELGRRISDNFKEIRKIY